MHPTLECGSASVDITPEGSQFLFGYPHVERYSTGVHDPLASSALAIAHGDETLILVANDVIFVSRDLVNRARARIEASVRVPAANVLVSATHTHSGPITVNYASNEADAAVPKADPEYLQRLEDGIVEAATQAARKIEPSEIGIVIADGSGVGTNRRDPLGPSGPQVPVLVARPTAGGDPHTCMVVCSMHPTVLHEDSTLVSADFPGAFRRGLRDRLLGPGCTILYHTGPCGNQSPRHVATENTFAEAERLGGLLAQSVAGSLADIHYERSVPIRTRQVFRDLPRRQFPRVETAEAGLSRARERLARLRGGSAPVHEVRTAEVDWFGAEETLVLARAAADGRLDSAYQSCLPAEVQMLQIGEWAFLGWPGEVFVEFSLEVRRQYPAAYVISLANGELQGYVVTEEAEREGGYEASNSLFSHAAGQVLVDASFHLLQD